MIAQYGLFSPSFDNTNNRYYYILELERLFLLSNEGDLHIIKVNIINITSWAPKSGEI